MAKTDTAELMVAAFSFVSDVPYAIEIKRGLTLLASDPIVQAHPKAFVPQSAGEQALVHRANQVQSAMESLRVDQMANLKAARIAAGSKFDGADDATVEASKKLARSDSTLELVHHEHTGLVIGVRPKGTVRRETA